MPPSINLQRNTREIFIQRNNYSSIYGYGASGYYVNDVNCYIRSNGNIMANNYLLSQEIIRHTSTIPGINIIPIPILNRIDLGKDTYSASQKDN